MTTRPNGGDRSGDARRAIVQRLCNYCHVLREDAVSCGDYVEQLTCLLFLRMVDEL
jgi:type I restriction enzyme M protein